MNRNVALIITLTVICCSMGILNGCRTYVDYPYAVGRIKGVVTDSLATPIPDVDVNVSGKEERALTDINGAYELDLVPTGEVAVIASKAGFKSAVSIVNVPVGEVKTSVNFVMRKE